MLSPSRVYCGRINTLRQAIHSTTTGSPKSSVLIRPLFCRFYGRVVRAIVSKHISSLSDTIRPIIPLPIVPDPSRAPRKQPRSNLPTDASSGPYPSISDAPPSTIELQDDISTTASETGLPAVENNIQAQVRKLMRLVPHPVSIITSTDPTAPTNTAFRGMTVSSFNTVTLNPSPVVSFNVKIPSETYNAIRASGRFLVHLLATNATTAKLAREFSKGHENITLNEKGDNTGCSFFHFTSLGNRACLPSVETGEPPRLTVQQPEGRSRQVDDNMGNLSDGPDIQHFPFILECQYLRKSVQVGDHIIVLGKVVTLINCALPDSKDCMHLPKELCLSYADTRFWEMGGTITPESRQSK
ncbi:hypothetical protein FQN57_006920 [Myotisia sp. PD_48]|nr:hypothetical protein FQN57_006920 [Myotisia sp. PD_48]